MAIKFDTLEELKAFCLSFQLTGVAVEAAELPKKRGRKPGSKNRIPLPPTLATNAADTLQSPQKDAPKKRGRKPKLQSTVDVLTLGAPKRRGRKPGSVNKIKAVGTGKRGRKPAMTRES
jgi:hypothetical protein